MDVASTLNVSRALKSPGLSLPFEADAQIPEMEVLGDPVRFEDIAVKGEVVGSSETVEMCIRDSRISQYTPDSRTRRAISWLYCPPKSSTTIFSVTDIQIPLL